uniref:Tripartite motif-containing protein 38 n=1 Tax=Magallana gigas TaxID=29159 RepID=K1RIS6_MAGGI
MAAISPKHPLESAQEHIPMCEKHNMNIDITCEDCDEFICSQCAKTDHKDHDWKTIPTAGRLRRRELKKTLSKVKDIYVIEMNEMIQTAVEQMENNQKRCEFEVSKLQKHFEAIVSKLDKIRKNYEKKLRGNLESKNSEINDGRLNLEKKKEQIMDVVEFIEEKHSTMSDYSLIDNLRDLTNLLSNRDRATINNKLELLVTLMDNESERYHLNSRSRRLVRHVTLTGDVIREYEYQGDGQTRLFTVPWRVKQNGNTDICVVNKTSESTSELMILSSSGCVKVVYRGQSLVKKCLFSDVVCDSRSNIIVSDMENGQIHLLGPDGTFVKYLLTQYEITHPSSVSLINSTLWVGNNEGCVKVFECVLKYEITKRHFF